ncbi:S8 family serine peptidase [Leptothoe sp. PORK10 BA2]|uniref:S8 family serine peptidase n=1 Tax=Leptothoe sp. PORK10 BA2 TaxID=3110254 RepID=UPI002B210565|nr:S8 family serine peptidase [Leptothoe sp. PORK10 BA2]MEA5464073.1 S8 family serine peptidase [Leptothoe sp. PORK10 BA2]
MFEDINIHATTQTTALEPTLVPTGDLMGYGLVHGQVDQAMSSAPTLDGIGLTSLSVLNSSDGLELFAPASIVEDMAIERQPVSANSTIAHDNLIGQAAVNLAASTAGFSSINYIAGTLGADQFFADLNAPLTVISGNGNVHYGDGYYDYLNLSNISSWSVGSQGFQLFDVGNGARLFDALTFDNGAQVLFEGLDGIQFADQWIDLAVDPNDPLFSEQWNLHMMGVHNAWRFTQGSNAVLVGVQDSGLGWNPVTGFHPDLETDLFLSGNVSDDFFREFPDAQYGPREISHGTGVQGIISATANNGIGTSGINWNSPAYHIDVLDANQGDFSLAQATQDMINQANSQGQRLVVNMSLGGGVIDPMFEALIASNQSNALFVIASGNDGNNFISNPASLAQKYANVMAVGASWGLQDQFGNATNLGQRIDYGSSYWGSNYGLGLSIMGPSEVFTTEATPTFNGAAFGIDNDFNGTSAAAPNVAGVASLVWSANPNLTATQVHQILAETAFDLGIRGYDIEYGHGFVNADAAVRRAMALRLQPATQWQSAAGVVTNSSWDTSVAGFSPEVEGQPPVQGSFGASSRAFQSWSGWSAAFGTDTEVKGLTAPVEAEPIAALAVQPVQFELATSERKLDRDGFTDQWGAWAVQPSGSIDALISELQLWAPKAEWVSYSLSA